MLTNLFSHGENWQIWCVCGEIVIIFYWLNLHFSNQSCDKQPLFWLPGKSQNCCYLRCFERQTFWRGATFMWLRTCQGQNCSLFELVEVFYDVTKIKHEGDGDLWWSRLGKMVMWYKWRLQWRWLVIGDGECTGRWGRVAKSCEGLCERSNGETPLPRHWHRCHHHICITIKVMINNHWY